MTISINHLNSIISSSQDVFLYNYNYNTAITDAITVQVEELVSLEDSTTILSSFEIEPFETTRGRVASFSNLVGLMGEMEIENTLRIVDTSPVFSPNAVINYKETVRYEVLDGSFNTFIDIPYEIRFLGQRLLSDSKTIVATTDLGMLMTVEDSMALSILSDAIDAKNIEYKQLFMPKVGQSNTQYSVSLVQYDIFNFPEDNAFIGDNKYINYITIPFIYEYKFFDEVSPVFNGEVQPYIQEIPVVLDLAGLISSGMSLHLLPEQQDLYSELMSFRSKGESLDFELMPLTTVPPKSTLAPVLSNELSMINIIRSATSDTSVPFLLSNNDKGYTLTSNYSVHGSYPLYNAFNGNLQSPTIFTSYRVGDMIVSLPEVQELNSYSVGIGSYYNAVYDAPSGWTVYASMDGVTYNQIDTVSLGRQMAINEVISRKINTRSLARFIKIYLHHSGLGGGYTRVGLLDFIFIDKSYDYKILDLDAYYSLPWEPVAKIYSNNDYVELNEILYSIATWNDHKDFNGIKKEIGRFSISSVEPANLEGLLLDYIDFSMQDVPDDIVDIDGYISPYMIIQAGIKEDTSKEGIYKGIYLDTHRTMVNSKTPWLLTNGSIVKIGDTKFYNMSFDNSELSIFKITGFKEQVITLDWERIYVEKSDWMIPEYRMHPYIRIDSDNFDFMIISLGVSGGSVTHLHRKDYIDGYSYGQAYNIDDAKLIAESNRTDIQGLVDASKAESYAATIGSRPYRRSAKILKDTLDGLIYDQYVIDDAISLVSKYEYCVDFFSDLNCNPIVLNSVIKDKLSGMVNKDVFSHTGEYVYSGVNFIHYVDAGIIDGTNNTSYVINHKDRKLNLSTFNLDISFNNFTPGSMVMLNIIDNCGTEGRCSNALIEGFNSIGIMTIESAVRNVASTVPANLLFSGDEIYIPIPFTYGVVDITGIVFENFVELRVPQNLEDIISKESNHVITIGTQYDGLMYEGRLVLGLLTLDGIVSGPSNFIANVPDIVLDEVYADFEIKLHIDTRSDFFPPYIFGGGLIEVDVDFISLNEYFDRTPYIWMKMFFPSAAGKSEISASIMDFNITERHFAKSFNIPYIYVDDPFIDPEYRTYKSSNGDVMEVKHKDFEDVGRDEKVEKQSDKICGPERSITYLDFQAFDHKLSGTGDRHFGNYTWEMKELLMAGYIRISSNNTVAPGKKISDADALEKTLYEVRLSFIDNLDVVADWHIEEFELTTVDFGISAGNSELLSSIDEQFRGLLKAVTTTLGDDIISYESREEANLFPGFPERPPSGNDFATIKVQQYFIVEEIEVVQN